MRILHLLGATEDTGGILTVLRNLQTTTAPVGIQHAVWVNDSYRETRKPPLDYRYTRQVIQDSFNHAELAWRSVRGFFELRRLMGAESFDVVHAHTRGSFLIAVALAALGSGEVVFTNHGYARRVGMYRWGARRKRLITCALTPNMARHYSLDTSADNVRIVSECCADSLFERPLPVRNQGANGSALRLVGLGNIVEWKNWHLLIEALCLLPAAEQKRLEFHHYGPVPGDELCRAYERRIRALIQAPRLVSPCVFHGLSLDVPKVLQAADWFVLPSTNEPCSVALIEALALGLPALVSASGGNVDIVSDERTGLLFTPDDPASLAGCLGRLACGEFTPASAAQVRESVRLRSATAVAAQYTEIYRRVSRRQRRD